MCQPHSIRQSMPGWNVSSGFGFGLLIGDVIKIFSPGRRRPPTTTGSQKASEVKGTTVGTLMGDLAHGGTRVIVFVFVNTPQKKKEETTFSGQLRSMNFRCYTADPNKRWELCEDLTCGKSEQFIK